MVVVKRTKGGLYILAELDRAVSKSRAAAFHVIPYLPHSKSTIPVTELVSIPTEELNAMTHEDLEAESLESGHDFDESH